MAYGNVTPPTLPTYDAETNGFYLLVFNYELGAESWYMVHLIYGAWRFQYEEGVGITNTGSTFTRTYSDGVWSEESQNTETLALNPGVNGQVYQRIYTNANIFNGDVLWLPENTVTPLDEEQRQINMKSQLAGFLAAWCAPVRQFPHREPVAFLYGHVAKDGETPTHTINGVGYVGVVAPKLPDLPDEYKEYTCAYVTKAGGVTFAKGYEFDYTDGAYIKMNPWLYYLLEDNAWVKKGSMGVLMQVFKHVVWATFPLVNQDGSEYLSPLDPIPIYE